MDTSIGSRAVRKAWPWYPRPPRLTTSPGAATLSLNPFQGGAPMKGRVAVLRAYGGEFELREYPVPEVRSPARSWSG